MKLYMVNGMWQQEAKPGVPWLHIHSVPKPHKRPLTSEQDYVLYTPKHILDYMSSCSEGRKYLARDYLCPCDHNAHGTLLRLFTNWSPGCEFLAPFPEPPKRHIRKLEKVFDVITKHMRSRNVQPWTLYRAALEGDKSAVPDDEFVAKYGEGGSYRDPKRYMRVYEFLSQKFNNSVPIEGTYVPPYHYLKKRAVVRPFGKAELLASTTKKPKPPRGISPRDPAFNLVWAQYIGPLEKDLYYSAGPYGLFRKFVRQRHTRLYNRWIAKGMNKIERGLHHHDKCSSWKTLHGKYPMVVSLDCAGFDAHVRQFLMAMILGTTRKVYPENVDHINTILRCLTKNALFTDWFSAQWVDGLMSGDRHTSFVACMAMMSLIIGFFSHSRIRDFDMFVDGDDTLIYCREEDFGIIKGTLSAWFLDFGLELKVEQAVSDPLLVTWCQCVPVPVMVEGYGEGYVFVQNPHRIFGSIGTHKYAREAAVANDYFTAQYLSYAVAYDFIPMFKSLAPTRKPKTLQGLSPSQVADMMARLKYHITPLPETAEHYCRIFDWCPMIYHGIIPERPLLSTLEGARRQCGVFVYSSNCGPPQGCIT